MNMFLHFLIMLLPLVRAYSPVDHQDENNPDHPEYFDDGRVTGT